MREGARGVWACAGPAAAWAGRYYHYRVTAFHPSTGRVETCDAADPYSRALAANGARAQVCDLEAAELKPPGWDTLGARKPALQHHVDAVLYELHVRDFSVADASVPAAERGTFTAFTRDAAGTRHLAALAAAGITHVHLLPVYDFGSVNERREQWREPTAPGGAPLSSFPPDSEVQQAAVTAVADVDGYNWCAAAAALRSAASALICARRAPALLGATTRCTGACRTAPTAPPRTARAARCSSAPPWRR
jgi:pullulanase/glycogen debranching enzyme